MGAEVGRAVAIPGARALARHRGDHEHHVVPALRELAPEILDAARVGVHAVRGAQPRRRGVRRAGLVALLTPLLLCVKTHSTFELMNPVGSRSDTRERERERERAREGEREEERELE
jgi:hypothetical protein